MPVPSPRPEEQESEFVSRCMSELYNEYGQDQAAGICYSQWKEKDNMSSDEFATLPTSECVDRKISDGYNEQHALEACSKLKPTPEDDQQGGVVSSFARTKFEYSPKAKEKMNDFMARCMSDDMVREKKPNRMNRGAFCWSEYQNSYVMSIGRNWK